MSNSKKTIYKVIVLLIIFINIIFIFPSCKKIKKIDDIDKINYVDILNQKGSNEGKYYVLIYSADCKYCQELEPYVIEYCNSIKASNDNPPLYILNVDDQGNAQIMIESDELYHDFVGTSNYQDIRFSHKPGLLEVTNQEVTLLISSKTTNRPYTEIKNLLSK